MLPIYENHAFTGGAYRAEQSRGGTPAAFRGCAAGQNPAMLLWMSRSFAPMDRPWSLADPNQRKERPMIPFVMAGHEGRVIHNLVFDHDPSTRIMVSITLVSPHEPCKKSAASRPCSISGSIAGDARRFLRDDGFPSSRPPNRSGLHYSALPRCPAAFAGTKSSACPSHRYFGRTFLARILALSGRTRPSRRSRAPARDHAHCDPGAGGLA